MKSKYKKIKKLGSSTYYISDDKKSFIKEHKGKSNLLKKEYKNLKKYWNKINIKNLQIIQPIKFLKEKNMLVTKYINAKSLIDILNSKIYFLITSLIFPRGSVYFRRAKIHLEFL